MKKRVYNYENGDFLEKQWKIDDEGPDSPGNIRRAYYIRGREVSAADFQREKDLAKRQAEHKATNDLEFFQLMGVGTTYTTFEDVP